MMPATGFTLSHTLYMVLSGLLALVGALVIARAADPGFAVFGAGLMVFGFGFGFWMLKRGLDAWETARS